ncbi:DUF2231 domain-containing protein [Litorimonas sp.]|uniref:DUF2231 domain-containing protein n=1 Tax=Litorimonas sp. TaxID=1892381 RepID=UPI003A8A8E0C
MSGFLEPNIHPVLVHFAYALSLSAFGIYIVGRLLPAGPRKESTQPAGDWMLALGALAIIGTIAAGFYAYYTVAHDGPSHAAMTTHRNWAVPSGTAILILAVWRYLSRAKPPGGLFLGLLAAAVLSLSVTAWWGGNIVYKYGLGVQSLPTGTGDGHDHDHGSAGETGKTEQSHDADIAEGGAHDNSDGHHDAVQATSDAMAAPNGHDNSDGHHDGETVSSEETDIPANDATSVVDQFGQALRSGNVSALKALLSPNVVIAEGGNAERSYAEYASHHMKSDMAYTSNITNNTLKRDVIQGKDMATVITQSEMVGNYKGESVHNRMMETMVLRRKDGVWKIAHIHWSSSPLSGSERSMTDADKVPDDHDNSDGHHDTPSGD